MKLFQRVRNENGLALVLVLFAALVVGAISAGAALISSNDRLIKRYTDRQSQLVAAADAGLEETRSRINGDNNLYPDTSYATLEDRAAVYDADGVVIPGLSRTIYVGPSGVTSGQYGVFGSVVVVVEDEAGNMVVRRGEVAQESFAKYAYFTDYEPSNIMFGTNDQIFGPVHSNSPIRVRSTGATFWSTVTTAQDVQAGPGDSYAVFKQGYTEYAPSIDMPAVGDLTKLEAQATAGNTRFVGNTNGVSGTATTRIEFVAVDIDGDGQTNGSNEGFVRVYQGDAAYVTATQTMDGSNENCGDYHGAVFVTAAQHPAGGHDGSTSLQQPSSRCFLGGDPELNGGLFQQSGFPDGGQWLLWPGAVHPLVSAAVGTAEAQTLFPINRQFNPSFKGVIYVEGKVVVSGRVRGQVTVVSTNDLILGDDLRYVTDPGAGTCNDIAGLTAIDDVIVADNRLNTPSQLGGVWRTYDETAHEFIHSVVLALDIFTVQNYSSGPDGTANPEPCEGILRGRGCLYLTGGIIQRTRGGVGTGSGRGFKKRYSYDQCAATSPPPYFPTTGHFARGRYYEIDPVGFDVNQLWSMMTPPAN